LQDALAFEFYEKWKSDLFPSINQSYVGIEYTVYTHARRDSQPGDLADLLAPAPNVSCMQLNSEDSEELLVSEMTYTVSSGTLNSTIPYHTIQRN